MEQMYLNNRLFASNQYAFSVNQHESAFFVNADQGALVARNYSVLRRVCMVRAGAWIAARAMEHRC